MDCIWRDDFMFMAIEIGVEKRKMSAFALMEQQHLLHLLRSEARWSLDGALARYLNVTLFRKWPHVHYPHLKAKLTVRALIIYHYAMSGRDCLQAASRKALTGGC